MKKNYLRIVYDDLKVWLDGLEIEKKSAAYSCMRKIGAFLDNKNDDLYSLTISIWRLNKWANEKTNGKFHEVQRCFNQLNQFLKEQKVDVIEYLDIEYSEGLPLIILNEEDIEENSVIIEMILPVVVIYSSSKTDGDKVESYKGQAYVGLRKHKKDKYRKKNIQKRRKSRRNKIRKRKNRKKRRG